MENHETPKTTGSAFKCIKVCQHNPRGCMCLWDGFDVANPPDCRELLKAEGGD